MLFDRAHQPTPLLVLVLPLPEPLVWWLPGIRAREGRRAGGGERLVVHAVVLFGLAIGHCHELYDARGFKNVALRATR